MGKPMKAKDCRGIFTATLTPLTDDERLDVGAYEKLVNRILDEGQSGLYVAGTTGEGYGLDDSVRVDIYKQSVKAAQARRKGAFVIGHVGGVPTKRAVALGRAAADAGCNAISAIPPTGGKYNYDEITTYYAALAKATPLPLIVYYIPAFSGYDFPRPQLSRWMEIPNVIGLKFTSFDMYRLERLITLHPDKAFFNGHDEALLAGLITGAPAAIGATYNIVGKVGLKIYAAIQRGDLATARKAQAALNAFIEDMLSPGITWPRVYKAFVAETLGWPSPMTPGPGTVPPKDAARCMKASYEAAMALVETLP
jgi:N-acetylneuraminate lyase